MTGSFSANRTQQFYYHDHLNSTRMVVSGNSVNGNAVVMDDIDYYPFGGRMYYKNGSGNTFHFTGYESDYESNTEHALVRNLSSSTGRFMRPDPYLGSYNLEDPQSLNRYSYVANRALNYADPTGALKCNTGGAVVDCTLDWSWLQTLWGWVSSGGDGGSGFGLGWDGLGFGTTAGGVYGSGGGFGGGVGSGGGGGVTRLPTDPTSGNHVSQQCSAALLSMLNAEHGTNLTSANITDSYNNGAAANIIVDASGLTATQFNSFQQGRYSTYAGQFLLGFGLAGHIANESGVNPGAVFRSSNIGGNLSVHFAFHDDHGYANNPLGALIHLFTDVIGHNSRNPC